MPGPKINMPTSKTLTKRTPKGRAKDLLNKLKGQRGTK